MPTMSSEFRIEDASSCVVNLRIKTPRFIKSESEDIVLTGAEIYERLGTGSASGTHHQHPCTIID